MYNGPCPAAVVWTRASRIPFLVHVALAMELVLLVPSTEFAHAVYRPVSLFLQSLQQHQRSVSPATISSLAAVPNGQTARSAVGKSDYTWAHGRPAIPPSRATQHSCHSGILDEGCHRQGDCAQRAASRPCA
jgi:hypothetical protein